MNVLHLKIPISQVHLYLDEAGKFSNEEIEKTINQQLDLFLEF